MTKLTTLNDDYSACAANNDKGAGGKLFIHTCDIHYLSTNIGTKQRAPDFYV